VTPSLAEIAISWGCKVTCGDRMHARDADAPVVAARLACNILNRMAELGKPAFLRGHGFDSATCGMNLRRLHSFTNGPSQRGHVS
tara:strand:+ start:2999 stop:3253 length:255 start_codon:yes stop_codon:yes gene_type:complete